MTKAPMKVLITCVVALATGLLPSSVFAMSCPVNMTLNSAEAVKQWRSDGRDGPFRLGVKEISACHD